MSFFGDCATNAVNHSLAALIASKTAHRVFNSRIFRINEAYNGFFAGSFLTDVKRLCFTFVCVHKLLYTSNMGTFRHACMLHCRLNMGI